jgi:NSS family neurotransmitter:Na+ symporter
VLLFLLGLGTVFSFNIWADWKPLAPVGVLSEKNFFEVIDYISSNLIMPMGGILMAVIAGWVLKSKDTKAEMKLRYPGVFYGWLFLVRFIAPLMLGLVFISNL